VTQCDVTCYNIHDCTHHVQRTVESSCCQSRGASLGTPHFTIERHSHASNDGFRKWESIHHPPTTERIHLPQNGFTHHRTDSPTTERIHPPQIGFTHHRTDSSTTERIHPPQIGFTHHRTDSPTTERMMVTFFNFWLFF